MAIRWVKFYEYKIAASIAASILGSRQINVLFLMYEERNGLI